MVHALDQRQFGVRFGRLEQPCVIDADLDVVAALDDQCWHLQLRKCRGRVLAEQGNQVRLHARTENHLQGWRHIVVGFPGLEAVEQFIAAQHQRLRQAIAQLLANDLIHRSCAAGDRNHRVGIDIRRSEAGDQGAFAVTQHDQLAKTRIGLEFPAPGLGIGHISFHRQIAFIRGRRQARGHATLVVTHAGDVVFGQHPGQALEAVIAPAVGVVSVTIRRAGA
ncbi:hypothetical protein D3C72_1564290 [compost metagenome]